MAEVAAPDSTTVVAPVDTSPPADTTPSWASDLAALDKEEWYTKLPEDVRPTIRTGLESRLKTWDKGYNQKFESLANDRKAWESERTKLEREAKLFGDLFAGNEDPRVAESATKLSELEQKLSALTAERDGYKAKVDTWERADIEKEADRVIEQYRDIIEYKAKGKDGKDVLPAWERFTALMETGKFTEEEAAGIVRPMFKLSAKPLPASLDMAGDGTRKPTQVDDLDGEDVPMHVAVKRAAERAAIRLGIHD